MLQRKTKLPHFVRSQYMASLDFCAGYWQCPFDMGTQVFCDTMTSKWTSTSTRAIYSLKTASVYCKYTVRSSSTWRKRIINAWIDRFMLHARFEKDSAKCFITFLEICTGYNFSSRPKSVHSSKRKISGVEESSVSTYIK